MAVQKSKVSRARRGNRRSHDKLKQPCLSIDSNSGEVHLRHHITPNGFYRGKKIIEVAVKDDEDSSAE